MKMGLRDVLFTMFLLIAAVEDWRRRRISVGIFVVFGICAGILWMTASGNRPGNYGFLAAFFPGLLSLFLTGISHGAVGAGDGCFFLITACYLCWEKVWTL